MCSKVKNVLQMIKKPWAIYQKVTNNQEPLSNVLWGYKVLQTIKKTFVVCYKITNVLKTTKKPRVASSCWERALPNPFNGTDGFGRWVGGGNYSESTCHFVAILHAETFQIYS